MYLTYVINLVNLENSCPHTSTNPIEKTHEIQSCAQLALKRLRKTHVVEEHCNSRKYVQNHRSQEN